VDVAAAIGKTGAPALQELTYAQRGKLFAQVPDTLAANRRKYEQIAIANSGNTRTDAAIDIDGEAKAFDPAAVDACLAAAPGYTMDLTRRFAPNRSLIRFPSCNEACGGRARSGVFAALLTVSMSELGHKETISKRRRRVRFRLASEHQNDRSKARLNRARDRRKSLQSLSRSANQKSLQSKSPKNGSISQRGWRLSGNSRRSCRFPTLGD
jgi:hypothetical protein